MSLNYSCDVKAVTGVVVADKISYTLLLKTVSISSGVVELS